jgi:hypothetical protein
VRGAIRLHVLRALPTYPAVIGDLESPIHSDSHRRHQQ